MTVPSHPRRRAGSATIDDPITLTRVYTRAGDAGLTRLADGTKVPKSSARIEACGAVDELNAWIGASSVSPGLPPEIRAVLGRIANELFDLGADLAVPLGADEPRLRVEPAQVAWLERSCDEVHARLEPLPSVVLPGGTEAAARLHVARTVGRRAERRVVALGREEPINETAIAYLNRLGDLLFVLARDAVRAAGCDEPRWRPGASTAARADERIFDTPGASP